MFIQRSYDKRNFIFLKGQNCLTSSVPKNTFLSDYKFLNNEIKKEKKINLGLIHCQKSSYIPSLNKNKITNTEPDHEIFKLSVGELPLRPSHKKSLSKFNSETHGKSKIQIPRNIIHKKTLSEEREFFSSFSSKSLLNTEGNKNSKETSNKIFLSPTMKVNNRILYGNKAIKKNKISLINEINFSERVNGVFSLKQVKTKINNDSDILLDKNNISTKEASCTTTLKMKSLIKKTNNKLINNSQDDNSSINNINKLESPEDIYFLIVQLIQQGKINVKRY